MNTETRWPPNRVKSSSADGDFWLAIKWAYSEDITDGCQSAYFCPWSSVNRAEGITFQFRSFHDFADNLEP